MSDGNKSKRELIQELQHLRNQLTELEDKKIINGKASSQSNKKLNLYQLLFNASPDFIFFYDIAAQDSCEHFIEVNENVCKSLGYTREELLSMSPADIISETDNDEIFESTGELLKDSNLFFKKMLIANNGERIPVEMNTRTIEYEGKRIVMSIARDINEQKRILEEHERILNLSNDLLCIAGMDGYFKYLNPAWEKTLGYTRDELLSKPFLDFIHPDDHVKNDAEVQKLASEQRTMDFENRYLHKDGSVRNISWTVTPLPAEQLMYCVGHDITESKRSEQALRTNEAQLSNAMMIAKLGYWEYDVASDLFTFNDHFYSIFRTSAEKVGGYTMPSARYAELFVHPDDMQIVSMEIRNALETSDPHYSRQLEHRIIYADGKIGYIAVRFFIIKDDQGRTIKTYGANQDITERKKAEEALRESEEKFKYVFDYSFIGKSITLLSGEMQMNKAFHEMLGYSEKELLACKWQDITHPDDIELSQKVVDSLLSGEKDSERFTKRYLHKNGAVVWADVSTTLRRDKEGKPLYLMAAISNITKRKEAEEALRKSEEILTETGCIARIGGWEHDLITGQATWTKALYDIDELESGPPPGPREHLDQYPPRDRAILSEAYQRAVEKGEPFDLELQVYTARKRLIWGRVIGRPIMKDGKCIRMMGTFQDITELKQAEHELAMIFNMSLDMISIANLNTATFTRINPAFYRILGYSEEELLSRPFLDFVHPDDLQRTKDIIEEQLKKGQKVISFENRYRCKDGSYRWLDWNAHPIPEKGMTFAIAHDVTERKYAEATLQESERNLSLASRLAHVGHWHWNILTGEMKWTEEVYKLFGVDINTYIPSMDDNLKYVHPEDLNNLQNTVSKALENQTLYQMEYRIARGDGTIAWCNALGEVIVDESGKSIGMRGSIQDISDRKHAEEALKESEQRFRELFNAMSNGVGIYQPYNDGEDFIFLDFNTAGEKIDSVKKDDIIGKKVTEVFPGVVDFGLLDVFKRVYRTGIPEDLPISFYKDNRVTGWRENYVYKLSSGEIVAVYDDMTERKKTEEKIIKMTERLQNIFDSSPSGIMTVDHKGFVTDWSPACTEIFGWTKDEIMGKFNPTVPVGMVDLFLKAIHERHTNLELKVLNKRGTFVDISLSTTPLYDENGNFSGSLGVMTDITNKKKAEEEQKNLISLIENSNDFIGIASIEGKVLYLNVAGQRLVGLESLEDAKSKMIFDFVSDELKEQLRQEIVPTVIKKGLASGESRLQHYKTGKPIDIHYNAFLTRASEMGGPADIAVVISDITVRKQAEQEKLTLEEQLRHAQKMEAIGTLAGGIAHDFNNLLTAILGNAEFIMSSLNINAPIQGDLLEITKAAKRAAALTNQLLAFSRRQSLQRKIINLNNIVDNVQKMLKRLIGEDIHLSILKADDLASTFVDPYQMDQVLINLAVNARDAMREGGHLVIKTENILIKEHESKKIKFAYPGHFVCLTIQDSGAGINTEIIEKIYDPFFTTKAPGSGTGLGLSVVHGIVEQHKGWINVNSEIGKGTTFKVYFPVISELPEEDFIDHLPREDFQGNRERILLVEDESGVREFLQKLLSANNYEVVSAQNAGNALTVFDQHEKVFDLVFCDVVLPDKNGLQLVEEILAKKPGIKVILSSGYMDQRSQMNIIKEKGYAFLQKPYDLRILFKTLQYALKREKQ